jgi:hypothetical protein
MPQITATKTAPKSGVPGPFTRSNLPNFISLLMH